MNCVDWEERIALYAGGDVAPAVSQAVERHVAECAGCQLLLSGLRSSLEFVRAAHGEPVGEAHFAAVRARVLSQLERGPAWRWRFAWVLAMAAAAIVLLVTMRPEPEASLALPMPLAPSAPMVAKVPLHEVAQPNRSAPLVAKAPLPRRQAAQPAETVLLKIETGNPDVVLYWIAETKGETK